MITKFKCKLCNKIKNYNFKVTSKTHSRSSCDDGLINQRSMINLGFFCPVCKRKLSKKYEGFACKHSGCCMYFKLEKGWVYMDSSENDNLRWTLKYDFDITRYENIKKWLILRSEMIYEKKVCEICKSNSSLEVHHILPRSSYLELTFDKKNLMVLCECCHKKIHSNDKYSFSGGNKQ